MLSWGTFRDITEAATKPDFVSRLTHGHLCRSGDGKVTNMGKNDLV